MKYSFPRKADVNKYTKKKPEAPIEETTVTNLRMQSVWAHELLE